MKDKRKEKREAEKERKKVTVSILYFTSDKPLPLYMIEAESAQAGRSRLSTGIVADWLNTPYVFINSSCGFFEFVQSVMILVESPVLTFPTVL